MFFGGSRSLRQLQNTRPRAVRGEDIHASVVIDLKDVILGRRYTEYDRNKVCQSCKGTGAEGGTSFKTCPTCNGTGYVKEEHRSFFGCSAIPMSATHAVVLGRIIDKRCSVRWKRL